MKRSLGSSDSLGALMSICPNTDEHSPRNTHVYGREFQSMLEGLDEEGCLEESGHVGEKKRRLSVDQVKALEKNFEVENKLEPERKVKLAQELGLQPRQVAVWFQNRRARWKTKQLERDYGVLKANYEALKLNYDALQRDNEALMKEVRGLKEKLNEEKTESNLSVIKEEIILPETDNNKTLEPPPPSFSPPSPPASPLLPSAPLATTSDATELNGVSAASLFPTADFGSSDSDSSAILNEENNNNNNNNNNSPNVAISLSAAGEFHHGLFISNSSSSPSCFPFSSRSTYNHTQFVKMEEHNFFTGEEACNFFSDEQAPTLQWYCAEQWN